jgi:hypothetical protein
MVVLAEKASGNDASNDFLGVKPSGRKAPLNKLTSQNALI